MEARGLAGIPDSESGISPCITAATYYLGVYFTLTKSTGAQLRGHLHLLDPLGPAQDDRQSRFEAEGAFTRRSSRQAKAGMTTAFSSIFSIRPSPDRDSALGLHPSLTVVSLLMAPACNRRDAGDNIGKARGISGHQTSPHRKRRVGMQLNESKIGRPSVHPTTANAQTPPSRSSQSNNPLDRLMPRIPERRGLFLPRAHRTQPRGRAAFVLFQP